MIELGGGTVNILYADGTSASFDPEELRDRLEKSFAASGQTDPWMAEEIVLAVEYALHGRTSNGDFPASSVIHAADIDDCVVRILEDSGYLETANHFRSSMVTSGDFGTLSPEAVEAYLAQKLQLTGPVGAELAAKIRQAMAAIGIVRCSPRLVLELARHFRDRAASAHRLPTLPVFKPDTVLPSVPEEKLLQIRRSDAVFPSIRAEIDLLLLFKNCSLQPPLTELSLIPILLPVAEQLDSGFRNLRRDGAEKYPLVLTLRGFSDFAVKWLCYEPDNMTKDMLKKRGRAFASCFASLLREKPFRTFLR